MVLFSSLILYLIFWLLFLSVPQWGMLKSPSEIVDFSTVSLRFISFGAPGWLSWLSDWLWLGPRSHSPWVWAPHRALCWQLRGWSLLQILCPSLSPPPPLMLLSKINEHLKSFLNKAFKMLFSSSLLWDWSSAISHGWRQWCDSGSWHCDRNNGQETKMIKHWSGSTFPWAPPHPQTLPESYLRKRFER